MDRETTSEGRLFLAALPDTVTADRIFDLSSVLKRAHRLSGKPILPKQLHVSLFFLGGLPDEMLRRVCKRVADVRAAPFEVSFDRTVSFRGRTGSRPFVLTGGDGPNPLK